MRGSTVALCGDPGVVTPSSLSAFNWDCTVQSPSVILAEQSLEMEATRQIYHRYVNTSLKMEKLITLSSEILLIFLET